MSYTSTELSHGEKPSTGWEYVLAFRAPDAEALKYETYKMQDTVNTSWDGKAVEKAGTVRKAILSRLRDAGFAYSQSWVPAAGVVYVRTALRLDVLHQMAENQALELQLRARYGGGYLAYQRNRKRCYVNEKLRDYFTPAERLTMNIEALGSSATWGAGIDVEKLIVDGVLADAFPLHDRRVRSELLEYAVYERWWDPLFRPSFIKLKNYFGARVTLYFAFLNFYARMLVGISVISIPVAILMSYSTSSRTLMQLRLFYGTTLVFWSTYFIKQWKRRNAILNVKWGNLDHQEDTFYQVRPQFEGRRQKGFYSKGGFVDLSDLDASSISAIANAFSFDSNSSDSEDEDHSRIPTTLASLVSRLREDIDFELDDNYTGTVLSDLPTFPCNDRDTHRNKMFITWSITFLFTLLMMSLTFFLMFYKAEMIRYLAGYSWGSSLPGVLLGVLIFCSENLWKFIYPLLARWENHRTTQEYMDSLIMKRFAFEFVASTLSKSYSSLSAISNSEHHGSEDYLSLFYIAFVKPHTPDDPCEVNPMNGLPDCMHELHTMTRSLVLTKATIQQAMELGIPTLIILVNRIILWYAWWRSGETSSSELRKSLLTADLDTSEKSSEAEDIREAGLNTFSNTVEDYGELVIQYGYVVLFGLAYPPATIVFFINNVIELRSDIFKYLFILNRAPAVDAAHIGKWGTILHILAMISIWTNSGIIVFTSNESVLEWSDITMKSIAVFFLLKQVLYWMTLAIDNYVKDIPGRTYRRKARQEYLIARWFHVGDKPYYRHTAVHEDIEMSEESVDGNLDLIRILTEIQEK